MILVDTSVWVDHLHRRDDRMESLLATEEVVQHPFVTGEIALGNLRNRWAILESLGGLTPAVVASRDEVMDFIERHRVHGLGVGYVDTHLLASARLMPGCLIWTRDRRFRGVAANLGLLMDAP